MTIVAALATAAALAALAGSVYQRLGASRDRHDLPPPGRRVQLSGRPSLHARCSGSGRPAVVLESGIAASSLSWTLVQPRVAGFTAVCSYDRAGLGWSDAAAAIVTAASNAEALQDLLVRLDLPPPYVLVGHSYGSFVLRAFAAQRPQDVAGLVLLDPIAPEDWTAPSPIDRRRLRGAVFLSYVGSWLARLGVVRFCLDRLVRGATRWPRRVSRMFGTETAGVLDHLVGEVQKLPPETWPTVRALWSQPKCFVGMARHLSGLPASAVEVEACARLGNIPLVVISAGRQPEASRQAYERMAALSTRGRHIVSLASGHWIHLDDPEIVVSAIKDLVDAARRHG
jgi:pimeloyl-ACP methyl ester carboxylesterase